MDFQSGIRTADGYLALPSGGTGPGVLILHAWWGLNDFFMGLCDRLAGQGYLIVAPDLYQGVVTSSIPEAERLVKGLDFEAAQAQVVLALEALRQKTAVPGSAVGVLGCSLGAAFAMDLSTLRPAQIAACVNYYGVSEADFSAARCAYLGHFAENDVFDSLDQAREMAATMRAAGREIDFYEYPGVGHWFIEEDRLDAYDANAAHLAWERTVSFLDRHLR